MRWLLALALLALAGPAPAEPVAGQDDPRFQAALAAWLADDEAGALPELAALAAADNRAAQVLLALIDRVPVYQGPWLVRLPRKRAAGADPRPRRPLGPQLDGRGGARHPPRRALGRTRRHRHHPRDRAGLRRHRRGARRPPDPAVDGQAPVPRLRRRRRRPALPARPAPPRLARMGRDARGPGQGRGGDRPAHARRPADPPLRGPARRPGRHRRLARRRAAGRAAPRHLRGGLPGEPPSPACAPPTSSSTATRASPSTAPPPRR